MRGGAEGVPAAGPGGCLTIPGPSQPLPPPPPLATPWAAFFTTSGYRALHEFRSQWNYFRILVNRKLRVFHKLSITAVRWAEHGLGASNGFERPRPLPGGGSAPPLAAPRPLQADGLCFTSPPPTNLAGIGFRLGLRRDSVWLDPDIPELCSHHGLRSTGLLSLIKGDCGPRALLCRGDDPDSRTAASQVLSLGSGIDPQTASGAYVTHSAAKVPPPLS